MNQHDTIDWREAARKLRPNGDGRYWAPENAGYIMGKLPIIDPITWMGKPIPERRWIVEDWIPADSATMLGGDGGTGKTLAAQQLMTAVATGQKWFGQKVTPCRAIGLFAEDNHDELQRRQNAINEAMGIDFDALENMQLYSCVGEDNSLFNFGRFDEPGETTQLFQQVHNWAQDFGAQLIVLDSLQNLFTGNENSRAHAHQFMNKLNGLARDCEGSVLLCAHPSLQGLSSGSGLSGSTAWSNATRSRLYFSRPSAADSEDLDPNFRILSRKKSNYASVGEVIAVRYHRGFFVVDEQEGGTFKAINDRKAENAFLACLDALIVQGRNVSDSHHATNFAVKNMRAMPQRDGIKDRDLILAMGRLFNMGNIVMGAPFNGTDRKPRRGIVRATVAQAEGL